MAIVELNRPSATRIDVADEALKIAFKQSMRELAGGVAVITAGQGAGRTGLTATSVSSLSAEPARLLVCINQSSSTWRALQAVPRFGVNVLSSHQQHVADRFAGRGGIKGEARYQGARWEQLETGASLLSNALAVIDCDVEEAITRHSHAIVIGRVRAVRIRSDEAALVYWRGNYERLGWSVEEAASAVGFANA